MFNRIHQKLGTAGFIISIVALVAALGGGAYAASGGLNGKQKKEVEKIAKKYAGKPGAAGATGGAGPTGPAGAAGAKGDAGAAGANGKDGTNGTNGTNGESVEAIPAATGGTECAGNGGAVLEPEGIEICNGSPWTVGSLPPGKTEMGTWAIGKFESETFAYAPISFSVPLATGTTLSAQDVHYVNPGREEGAVPATTCLGTASEPVAPAGTLCIYAEAETGTTLQHGPGPSRAGLNMFFEAVPVEVAPGEFEPAFARGTWAVTAPTS